MHTPRERAVYLGRDATTDAPRTIVTAMANIQELHLTGGMVVDGFLLPDINWKLLPSLRRVVERSRENPYPISKPPTTSEVVSHVRSKDPRNIPRRAMEYSQCLPSIVSGWSSRCSSWRTRSKFPLRELFQTTCKTPRTDWTTSMAASTECLKEMIS